MQYLHTVPLLCSQSKDGFTKVPAWVHLEEAEFVLGELMFFFPQLSFQISGKSTLALCLLSHGLPGKEGCG